MNILIEGTHTGEFLLSEANGRRSRKSAVITGGNYKAGQLMRLDADKYTQASTDGSDATAVLYAAVDASSEDQEGVVIRSDAEVAKSLLVYPSTVEANQLAADATLATVGIIVRKSV